MKQRKLQKFNLVLAFVLTMAIIFNGSIAMVIAEGSTTLQEQIHNAQNRSVISLQKDYNEAVTIPAEKEITLDLNGHTLTTPSNTVIKNDGVLVLQDSVGTGAISKDNAGSDTYGIFNNGTITILSGSINISTSSSGISFGVNNTGTLTMKGGNISSVTTGSNWAFGIYNTGQITEISGGSIKGQINNKSNPHNALGISTENGATIDLISGGVILAEVNNDGIAYGIRNRGQINEIKGGSISALTTGSKWAFAFWNEESGVVTKIAGGSFFGEINNPSIGNNALGISNNGVIQSIAGGIFHAQINGSGSAYGVRSDKEITLISGGAFRGNTADNALFKRNGTMNFATGYSLTNGSGFRYVMPGESFYVELLDKEDKWVATYVYNLSGELVSSLGEKIEDKYTVFSWTNDQTEDTVECSAEDFGAIKENATLYVNNTDKPLYYFLGSSVTYGHTTGGVSFVDYLAENNNWICKKRAVSGTTLIDNGSGSYVQRMKNEINPNAPIDHFVVQLSTNDASQNKPLGMVSVSKNINEFDTSTIIGAMEYIIAYAYENWDCPVTFYTNPRYSSSLYVKMVDALYDLQEKWDIGIIDFYNYRNMDELTSSTLSSYMSDSIHPNANGYKWMAEVMSELLTKEPDSDEPAPTENPTPTPVVTPTPTPTQTQTDDSGVKPTDPKNEDNTKTGDSSFVTIILLLGITGVMLIAYKKKSQA